MKNKMKNICKTLKNKIVLPITAGTLILGGVGLSTQAQAMDFPEKGKVAVSAGHTITDSRKGEGVWFEDYEMDLDFKSKETAVKVAYGLTDSIAPYIKFGKKDLTMKTTEEDVGDSIDFDNGLVYGLGITARVKDMPFGMELRGKIGYESSENKKNLEDEEGAYKITVSQDKIPASITAYKDLGKFSVETGIAYEHLDGKINIKDYSFDEDIDYKGEDNLGVLLNVGFRPKDNIELNAGYNSIGKTVLFGATIKF